MPPLLKVNVQKLRHPLELRRDRGNTWIESGARTNTGIETYRLSGQTGVDCLKTEECSSMRTRSDTSTTLASPVRTPSRESAKTMDTQ